MGTWQFAFGFYKAEDVPNTDDRVFSEIEAYGFRYRDSMVDVELLDEGQVEFSTISDMPRGAAIRRLESGESIELEFAAKEIFFTVAVVHIATPQWVRVGWPNRAFERLSTDDQDALRDLRLRIMTMFGVYCAVVAYDPPIDLELRSFVEIDGQVTIDDTIFNRPTIAEILVPENREPPQILSTAQFHPQKVPGGTRFLRQS